MCEEVGTDATAGGALLWDILPDVVLRGIFKRLPTSTLVSACSLVNKHWNVQSRSFIRDHRECTVKIGYDHDDPNGTNIWSRFFQLDQVLGGMRIIPFNSLRIVITDENLECDEEADVNALTNLMTKFPLKFLSVYDEVRWSCSGPAAPTVFNLLRQNSSNLQELEIRGDVRMDDTGIFKDWETAEKFEKLKKLSIAEFSSVSDESIKKIIASAPKLTAVYNNCRSMIIDNIIPHNMYGTLKRLSFCIDDLHQVEKFADKLDHLEEFDVVHVGKWYSSNLPGGEEANKRRLVQVCRKVLRLNAGTLRTLQVSFRDDSLWSLLQLPTLRSVHNLSLTVGNIDNSVIHINFPVSFPNLRQVRIHKLGLRALDNNNGDMNLDEDIVVTPNASQTTVELFFGTYAMNCTPDLVKLRKIFPNVLKFIIEVVNEDCQPLGCIANLWPNLKSLIIDVRSFEEGALDAQVLGLHPEELELLRYEGAEFLNRVQVPPSRPCVGTLKELEHFEVDDQVEHDGETAKMFLELVKALSISRRPGLNFKMETFRPSSRHWNTPRFGDYYQTYFEY